MQMQDQNLTSKSIIAKPVRVWLFIGLVMVFFQVVIGGITRLTDSGLSITEWAVIQGTLPPMNPAEWDVAFDAYKVMAKKQYETLHADMTMSEFKFIYFWEYFHRLWARLMGFVFIFPFFYFLWKKWMPGWLLKRLGMVILLAALAATFGWIMVASGLNDNTRTWVSAYKLSVHLSIATALFAYLFWTWLKARQTHGKDAQFIQLKNIAWTITGVLFLQIIFGGLMAGMRAGLLHPHFPFFVEGDRLMSALTVANDAIGNAVIDYEPSSFVKGVVQIIHRATAYILSALIVWYYFKARQFNLSNTLRFGNNLLLGMLVIQFLLGVFTVINSIGRIPLGYGVLHQGGALILLAFSLYINYQFKEE